MLSKEQKVKDQEVKFISVEKNYKPKVMNPTSPPPPNCLAQLTSTVTDVPSHIINSRMG